MSYQIICYYFSFPNIHYVDYNDDTNELQTMHYSELYGPDIILSEKDKIILNLMLY